MSPDVWKVMKIGQRSGEVWRVVGIGRLHPGVEEIYCFYTGCEP